MRALLSVVVASVEIEINPAKHPVAQASSVGMIATSAGRKRVHFDLTTAIRCMSALAIQSSDMPHTALIDLFENRMKPRVGSMMSQGHSAATAFESLNANASWLTGETELRAALSPAHYTGAPVAARAAATKKTGEDDSTSLRAELKKANAELSKQTKLYQDQKTKNERMERQLSEARRSRSFGDSRGSRSYSDRDSERSPTFYRGGERKASFKN